MNDLSRLAPLLLTLLLPLLLFLPGGGLLLVLLAPLTLWPLFRRQILDEHYLGAWRSGMIWAVLLSGGVIAFTQLFPEVAADRILNGEPYRAEMFGWIDFSSGAVEAEVGFVPKENSPRQFLPEHALHLFLFLLLTWATGGFLGLVLGAGLVCYMSYFVGSYAMAAGQPFLGAVVGWVPWSVVRVMAFVLLGVIFSRPLLVRRWWPFGSRELRWMALGAVGILADVLLKTFLAEPYGRFLHSIAEQWIVG